MSVTDGLGQPIHALSLALRDEYRLFVPKPSEIIAADTQPWVHKYPLAWAETAGMGLAKQRHPVVIEIKAEATPVRVRQYPMSQEAWRGKSLPAFYGSWMPEFSSGANPLGTPPYYR